jgi:hypothetical protein
MEAGSDLLWTSPEELEEAKLAVAAEPGEEELEGEAEARRHWMMTETRVMPGATIHVPHTRFPPFLFFFSFSFLASSEE